MPTGQGADYADYMLRAAMEGDSAQWNKAKADTLATPGLEPAGKLDILARGIAGMDFEQEGWKIAAGIPELHASVPGMPSTSGDVTVQLFTSGESSSLTPVS